MASLTGVAIMSWPRRCCYECELMARANSFLDLACADKTTMMVSSAPSANAESQTTSCEGRITSTRYTGLPGTGGSRTLTPSMVAGSLA